MRSLSDFLCNASNPHTIIFFYFCITQIIPYLMWRWPPARAEAVVAKSPSGPRHTSSSSKKEKGLFPLSLSSLFQSRVNSPRHLWRNKLGQSASQEFSKLTTHPLSKRENLPKFRYVKCTFFLIKISTLFFVSLFRNRRSAVEHSYACARGSSLPKILQCHYSVMLLYICRRMVGFLALAKCSYFLLYRRMHWPENGWEMWYYQSVLAQVAV